MTAREVVGQQPGRPKRSATAAEEAPRGRPAWRSPGARAPRAAPPAPGGGAAARRARRRGCWRPPRSPRDAHAHARRRPRSRRSATGLHPGAPRRHRPGAASRGGLQHPVERAAVQAPQPARLETGQARAPWLDHRPGGLQGHQHALPRIGDPRRDRAARGPGAGSAPALPPCACPGGCRSPRPPLNLPHQLLAARLGGQGGRAPQERLARTHGDHELETREQDTDDGHRTHVRTHRLPGTSARAKARVRPLSETWRESPPKIDRSHARWRSDPARS